MKNTRPVRKTESFVEMLGPVWKAVAVAALLTIALILLFALCMKLGVLDDASVPIVNQAIKVLGILLAAFFATRKDGRKIHRAVVSGVAYIIFSIAVFSLLEGTFAFALSMLWDILMGALLGLLAGVLFTRTQKS
jgi:putative membrane protein (TIGR04086 family)